MIRLESRARPSVVMTFASPLVALVLTAAIAALLFVALGKDPVRGLSMFFVEPLNGLRPLTEVLLKATPLVLCALDRLHRPARGLRAFGAGRWGLGRHALGRRDGAAA